MKRLWLCCESTNCFSVRIFCKSSRSNLYEQRYQTSKAVTIGLLGYTNAIFYQFDVKIPEHQAYLQIESPTGYLAMEFNTFWTINLATGAVTPQNAGPAETPDPVIISTSDQKYAMGGINFC